jgi:hypothetical protein
MIQKFTVENAEQLKMGFSALSAASAVVRFG